MLACSEQSAPAVRHASCQLGKSSFLFGFVGAIVQPFFFSKSLQFDLWMFVTPFLFSLCLFFRAVASEGGANVFEVTYFQRKQNTLIFGFSPFSFFLSSEVASCKEKKKKKVWTVD